MLICPIRKENNFIVPVREKKTKHRHFRRNFAPLWPWRQNFNTWDLSWAYIMYVKCYLRQLRFAGVIRGKEILSICMRAYNPERITPRSPHGEGNGNDAWL